MAVASKPRGDVTLVLETEVVFTRIPNALFLFDQIKYLENEIVSLLSTQLEGYMITLAQDHPVPGYDQEDLLQEMRIAIYEKIKKAKYNPKRSLPITYFSWVFRTTLSNLNAKAHRDCRIAASYAESLDEFEFEGSAFKTEDTHVFCGLCSRIVDPHSNYQVFTQRVTDPTLVCEICLQEAAHEKLKKYT